MLALLAASSALLQPLVVAAPAAAATYTAGDVVVVRVGTGSAALTSAATAVFLDEYSPSGALVQSTPLPQAVAGANAALTMSGTATSEGALSLSGDGKYLALAGYAAVPGTASVTSSTSAAVSRVVARVGADGAVDTSTALTDAQSGSNVRGAVTDDGSRFWTTGGAGGIRLASLGATTSAAVSGGTTVTNFRVPEISVGKLYVSSASGVALGINQVGTGLPTSGAGLTALLAPAPASPYAFVLLDRDQGVAGPDTLYVADDNATTGGVLKYSFDGTTWTARGSLRPNAEGARGVTGIVGTDGSAKLFATTSTSTTLVAVTDTAAFDATLAATATTLASPATNTAFRGIALAPQDGSVPTVTAPSIATQPASVSIVTGSTATLTVSASGTAPLAYQWYEGTAGDTSTPVGTGSASFTSPALTTTTSYWVRVSNTAGAVDSGTATVTVAAACSASDTAIGAVQGSTDTSPVAGTSATVQGTVVGDYEGPSPALRGFYLQDSGDGDAATSDGLFVFNNLGGTTPDSVALGQVVQVTGTVSEFQGQTQVTATSIEQCGQSGTVTPTDVTLPRATAGDLEPYEGMLVRFHQSLTVTEHFQLGRFGQVVVSSGGRLRQPTALYPAGDPQVAALQAANGRNSLIMDDGSQSQNPDPIVFGRGGSPLSASNTLRGGDTVTDPVGVLTYTWAGNAASGNAFRLRPVNALGGTAEFVAANPRPTAAPAVGGTVKVAGANLLNFFNTFGTGACTFGVGGTAADCRGAEDATEYGRQLAKEVAVLGSLNADVVGVMELENDGYGADSAIQSLVGALNAQQGAGTWAFVDPDAATGVTNAAGTDAIRAALLYKPAAVTPVPGLTFTDTAIGAFERNPLAQTFVTPDGGRFTVVANHFKSKGSCPAVGDPNADAGDGQGCWNLRRTQEAQELVRWLGDTVLPAAADPDVLVVGDLNSYAHEDPIRALESAGFVNLPRAFNGDEAYSYVFDNQWGYLDFALASTSLRPQVTGTGDYHVNADEPSVLDYNTNFKSAGQLTSLYAADPFRTSDHDPVLVGMHPDVVATFTGIPGGAVVGAPYSFAFTASGTAPVTFAVTAGTLPPGLALSASGVLSGTPVSAGTASFSVTASNTAGGQSRDFSITTAQAATTTAITSSVDPATFGQPVTWKATVTAATPGAPAATGTVLFSAGAVALGAPVAVLNGVATSPATATLPAGVSTVTAVYSGDSNLTGSTAAFSQQVLYGLPPFVSPLSQLRYRAGSIVPVVFRLTDAAGHPIPDSLAFALATACRVKVSAAGAQTLRPSCVLYDPRLKVFAGGWVTARGGVGQSVFTVQVSYPGITLPQSRSVTLTFVR